MADRIRLVFAADAIASELRSILELPNGQMRERGLEVEARLLGEYGEKGASIDYLAGTYTPFALLALRGPVATETPVAVWAGAVPGCCSGLCGSTLPRLLFAVAYVALGWVAVAACRTTTSSSTLGMTRIVLRAEGRRRDLASVAESRYPRHAACLKISRREHYLAASRGRA